ncbi:hypothetical protein O2V63_16320 [Modestobacter sp. VKM Ac-2977]|uniref:hypothetical protein n=1 Tax=Modestobacter sp. VKM Ac-2977 TaxID=3004131 RepID=UPI0022AABF5E|nr:hypothetical protein [Modestobacter sp. VKM Ac-2977]MCZ2821908.1 hypothetical protein [Modestobacter sp. VKM Ac-2977]
MSRTDTLKNQTLKQQGETFVRTGLLAALGAGDVAVDRARTVVGTFRTRAEALPGEAQVQADLAGKEARSRVEAARTRAAQAAAEARVRAEQARGVATTVRPETVLGTVTGLVEGARTQALGAIEELAGRGEKVVDELRTQPVFRKVVARTERAVDAVEDTVEDVLEETGETVGKASDEVTSVAQKAKSRTDKAVDAAQQETQEVADSAKRSARETAAPAKKAPAKKAAAKRTTKATPATVAPVMSEGTTLPDPLAVPAKSTDATS